MHNRHECGCGHAHTETRVDEVVRLTKEVADKYEALTAEERLLVDGRLEELGEKPTE